MDGHDPPDLAASAGSDASASRMRLVLVSLALAYGISLAALAALDQVAVMWKTLVVPGLALAAALVGRFRAFARDWAIFLAAVVLFDAMRGLVFGLVTYFDLPVYMHYAIAAERALFGEPLLTVRVQSLLLPGAEVGALDRFLAVIYASHFLAFLLFGLTVWLLREHEFARYKLGMLLVMYGGIVCYLVVPTVPPWMAARVYHVLPGVRDLGGDLFHGNLPQITAAFDLNPVAAMPSLHCAFPTLLTLIAFRHFGRWGFAMAGYTLCVYVATIHLAHHYAVDVLGGIALALVCYGLAYRSEAPLRAAQRLSLSGDGAQALRLRILVAALLLMLTQASSVVGPQLTGGTSPLPSEDFIARELDGRSPTAALYRGKRAYAEGRHAEAKRLLARAAAEVPSDEQREAALGTLVLSAYEDRDYALVVSVARRLNGMPPGVALILAESLVRTGQREAGFDLLDTVARRHPGHPDVLAVQSRLAPFRQGG